MVEDDVQEEQQPLFYVSREDKTKFSYYVRGPVHHDCSYRVQPTDIHHTHTLQEKAIEKKKKRKQVTAAQVRRRKRN